MRAGIITYHSAHNYGAVIQAYALQKYVADKISECKIIDFRLKSQKDYYALYPIKNGKKRFIKSCLMLPYHRQRKKRRDKFELFIHNKLILTKMEYNKEENLIELNDFFDCFISGSDQIWNTTKHPDKSNAYFLSFAGQEKGKLAYAVSIGKAELTDLVLYKKFIKSYDMVSSRETRGSRILSELLQKEVPTLLDPTLLLEKKYFMDLIKGISIKYQNYIFYYSLDGFDKRKNHIKELKILSDRTGKQIVALTPEWPKHEKTFISIISAGPEEFLALLYYADIVCTNSFHGTALSIAFEKDFYVLEKYDGKDDRKQSILEILNLKNRCIDSLEQIRDMFIETIDYEKTKKLLQKERKKSQEYLNLFLLGERENLL